MSSPGLDICNLRVGCMLIADISSEAILLRNSGGRAYKALDDILFLDSLLGFSDILVIHHNGQ
jgi:hypothetical protein